jgi:hypothetical protein
MPLFYFVILLFPACSFWNAALGSRSKNHFDKDSKKNVHRVDEPKKRVRVALPKPSGRSTKSLLHSQGYLFAQFSLGGVCTLQYM